MDPTANLKEQLKLAKSLIEELDKEEPEVSSHDVCRLAELVISLDNWLVGRGHLPRQWLHIHHLDAGKFADRSQQ